jgi:hypothetical protein
MSPVGQSVAHCEVKFVPIPIAFVPASAPYTKQHTWPAEHWAVAEHPIDDPVHAVESVQPAIGAGIWLWSPQQHTWGLAQAPTIPPKPAPQ